METNNAPRPALIPADLHTHTVMVSIAGELIEYGANSDEHAEQVARVAYDRHSMITGALSIDVCGPLGWLCHVERTIEFTRVSN